MVIATIVYKYKKSLFGLEKVPHLAIIKEFRVPINGYEYGFPAGLIDQGETPEDAVKRELEEETGLKIIEIDEISPPVVSSAGISNEAVYLAYVRATGEPNKDKLESSEDIETFLLSPTEVANLLKDKSITFGKSAYTIMRNFAKHGDI